MRAHPIPSPVSAFRRRRQLARSTSATASATRVLNDAIRVVEPVHGVFFVTQRCAARSQPLVGTMSPELVDYDVAVVGSAAYV